MLLVELIRSYLEDIHGETMAISMKGTSSGIMDIYLYDTSDLIDQVESGNLSPIPNIVGHAQISDYNLIGMKGDSLVGYIAKMYLAKESSKISNFIKNHYYIINFLRKNDAKIARILK